MSSPNETTRRAALTALAAVPLAAGLPAVANAAGPDPIFAVIDKHRETDTLYQKFDEADRIASRETAHISISADPDKIARGRRIFELLGIPADGRNMKDALEFENFLADRQIEAWDALASVVPTTMPGLLALAAYFSKFVEDENNDVLSWSGSEEIVINMGTAARALSAKTEA